MISGVVYVEAWDVSEGIQSMIIGYLVRRQT